MVAWSEEGLSAFGQAKSDSCLILFLRVRRRCSINVRFPENSMFTKANEADENERTEMRVLCVRSWIKSQHLQYKHAACRR